jgi:predicted DNA-binding helix-hairpin-helix protein
MERIDATARILRRKHGYKGYIHLKIVPGASDAAIEDAISLSNAVSLNIEVPGENNLAKLSSRKKYIHDIIEPMKLISRLTARGQRYEKVKQTTQFVVGAAGEQDKEIVRYMWGLYDRLKIHRVYFSAYQKGLGDESIAGEQTKQNKPTDIFMREHRLYQVDFLFRKYGFKESDIIFENNNNLSPVVDPKEAWATRHPEVFQVDINRASRLLLLRVPGFGPITVKQILQQRKKNLIRSIEDIGKVGLRLQKAKKYLRF